MGRTVRRQNVRGRNLVGTNCKGRIIGGRSVRGQTVGVPIKLDKSNDQGRKSISDFLCQRFVLHIKCS